MMANTILRFMNHLIMRRGHGGLMCSRLLPSFLGSDLLHPQSLWRDARVAELLVQPGRVARRPDDKAAKRSRIRSDTAS